jgi:hypothetical protein
MSDTSNKQRILKIMKIFKKDTDMDNKLAIDELISKLRKEIESMSGGIFKVDKKTDF